VTDFGHFPGFRRQIPRPEHKKNIRLPSFPAKLRLIQILVECANPMSDQRFNGVNY
jgi:hypothetical protein